MVLVSLEADLRDREWHEAVHLGGQTMPRHQPVERGHRARETCLDIRPAPVHDLLEGADHGEPRPAGLHEEAVGPLPALTHVEGRGIPRGRMEGRVTPHAPRVCHRSDEGLNGRGLDMPWGTI